MKRYKIAILDFDGTLADTKKVIIKTMHDTLRSLDLPGRTDADIAATIGLPLDEAFQRLAPGGSQQAQRCAAEYRRIFAVNNRPGIVGLFPGVADTMRLLHRQGVQLAIASSRGHESLDGYVSTFGFESCVGLVIGADDVQRAKPDPQPVEIILAHCGLQPSEAVVVGDTAFDILMGRRAGCDTVGVTYGNGSRQQLADSRATHIIDSFGQLAPIVLGQQ